MLTVITRKAFYHGCWRDVTMYVDLALKAIPQRYRHMVGEAAIDTPPTSPAGWFNRMCALTHWAAGQPPEKIFMRLMLKAQAKSCLQHIR